MECPLCNSDQLKEKPVGKYVTYCCRECSLQSVPDFGNEEEFHKTYFENLRANASIENELRQKQYLIDADHFLTYVKEGSVLDVGCSRGYFAGILHGKGSFSKITGIDIDENAIKHASENSSEKQEFFVSDIGSFQTNLLYDAVIFRGTLQYMSTNLQPAFEKITSLLKPGGYIIVYSLPNADSFIFSLVGENWRLFNPQEHKLFFNERSVKFLAEKYGLSVEEISYPYLGTPYENKENDYALVKEIIKNKVVASPPFWGNIMQLVLRK